MMMRFDKLLLLICLISTTAFGQSYRWLDSASTWHYTYSDGFSGGYQKNTYVGDTTIYGKNCQMIKRIQESKLYTGPDTYIFTGEVALPNYYTYKSNDSIFVSDNGAFYFAFKLNPSIGEIWNLGEHTNFMTNGIETAYVKVDTIIPNDYNGTILDDIYLIACKNDGTPIENSFPSPDTLVFSKLAMVNAKFGSFGGFESFRNYFVTGVLDETFPVYLLCFESADFDFTLINPTQNTDCYNGIFASISENELEKFAVKPNPTQNEITISNLPPAASLVLYDQQMKKISEKNNVNFEEIVSLQMLENGLYFIQILSVNGEIVGMEKVLKVD
jgi:hypothetical protein